MRGASHTATRGICGAGGRNIGGVRGEGRRSRTAQGPRRALFARRPHAASPTPAAACAGEAFAGRIPFAEPGSSQEARLARLCRARGPLLRSPSMFRPPAPQNTPLRALPRASRGAHGSGRFWGVHPRLSRGAKRKPGGFPPGFVFVVWCWLRLGLAALQEQRKTGEGQRSGRGLGDGCRSPRRGCSRSQL